MVLCNTFGVVICQSSFKGGVIMIEGKGLGGKRICRVNLSLSNSYDSKLRKLATACNMSHTTLASMILEQCLDNPVLVNQLQKDHCKQKAYKVVVIQNDGEIQYALTGREDL
jgi:hypothetical protein